MTFEEYFSLVVAITSIILALVAIGLSAFFFGLSKEQSENAGASAARIEASVKHLDFVTQKLYADLFSLVRENFGKLQDHALDRTAISQSEIEAREAIRQQELEKVRKELKSEVKGLSTDQFISNTLNQRLESLEALVDKTIEQAGTAASSATMEFGKIQVEELLLHLDGAGLIEVGDLLLRVDLSQTDLYAVLSEMRKEGTIEFVHPIRSGWARAKGTTPKDGVRMQGLSSVAVSEELALDSYVYHSKFEDELG